jgi:dTDP-4-dehydrorhamnose reductase
MKILVVGRGWTGRKVYNEFLKIGYTPHLASHYVAIDLARSYEYVVNCAGVTGFPNVDACEKNKSETLNGNAIFPIRLFEECDRYNVKFAHFSSGCIYQGAINNVDADPNFFGSIYSISKGVSDIAIKNKALMFRIRMPFTGIDEQKNYLTKVLKYAKEGKLIDFGQNSLTDHDEAVRVACQLVLQRVTGTHNLVNSGSVNMHELADMLKINPEWYTPEEFANATAAGRSTCTIPASERMRPIKVALQDAISKLNLPK